MSIVRVVLVSVACLLTGLAAVNASEVPSVAKNVAAERIGSSPLLPAPATVRSRADKPIVLAGRRRRYRNGAIIGGIALGVLGAIAAAEAAPVREREEYLFERRCRRWARLCDRGRIWACDRYDRTC